MTLTPLIEYFGVKRMWLLLIPALLGAAPAK
jgi:hypothetical protein